MLEAVIQETPVLFVNIYAPNKMHEQEAFSDVICLENSPPSQQALFYTEGGNLILQFSVDWTFG